MTPQIVSVCSFLSVVLCGCASTVFESRVDRVGKYQSKHEYVAQDSSPRLFIESLPPDINISGTSFEFDKNTYEYLGQIIVERNWESWDMGFISFNEEWRRYYCPVITPLTYGSLFILGVTPLPYFCVYEKSRSVGRIEERKANIANAAIKKGKQIGATDLVMASYSHLESTSSSAVAVPVGNTIVATGNSAKRIFPYAGMTCHAFKKKQDE